MNQWNFALQKSRSSSNLWKMPASKPAPCKGKRYKLWILLNLSKKCLKFGENRRKVKKIYDSVRKELQDECHCAWSLLNVTWTCLIWQPEKMVEKLNRSSCLVKFCWLGIIAQAAGLDCWSCCWFPRKTCVCWSTCEASGSRADERTLLHTWSCCNAVERCSSWGNFHSCGLTASWYGDLTKQHPTTVL